MTGLDAATRERLRERAKAHVEARWLIPIDPRELLALLDAADRVALLEDVAGALDAALARLADHDQETSQ